MRHFALVLATVLAAIGLSPVEARADDYGITVVSMTCGRGNNGLMDTQILVRLDDGGYGYILANTSSSDYFVNQYGYEFTYQQVYNDAMALMTTSYVTRSRLFVRTGYYAGFQRFTINTFVRLGS